MAVYTKVPEDALRSFLRQYDLGELRSCEGIEQGVENSNFHLFTTSGRYILTLFEKRVDEKDLPFFFAFKEHLAKAGIACPSAVDSRKGTAINVLCGRPAAIVTFLEGGDVKPANIAVSHCAQVGEAVARMHLAARNFPLTRVNSVGLDAWKSLASRTASHADDVEPGLARFIADELRFLEANWPRNLPRAAVHVDIFPDNVFFHEGQFAGIIDFYFAATDFLAYDLALVINAWCFDPENRFSEARYDALLNAYESLRPLTEEERANMTLLCRGAAMRILMTRLHDWVFHPPGAVVTPKDPAEYIEKLRFHQRGGTEVTALLEASE
ncbi:MAG: homoserine kinase [Alphaproteobacteria bacterium]|nr:homoserine kinase [Alphaproteobacteria bacterium]